MMIMEYMEHGSLQEVLLNPSIMMEAELIHSILKDIAQGVRFLHASNPPVIHGDLKPGNVLIAHRKAKKATGTPCGWLQNS
jgi:serine/threonine-protein kinase TNNI3K